MFTKKFWKAAAERAAKTAAEALALLWAGDRFNALDADWRMAAGVALGAAILSLLFSLASSRIGQRDDPSLV